MKSLLIAAAVLVVLALLLMLVPGFRFSIVLCLAAAGLCVLFCFLLRSESSFVRRIRIILYAVLTVGIIAAGITSVFILRAAHPSELPTCRYVIVLGAGVNGTEPSLTLQERINAAYTYLSKNPEAIAVLSGGQGANEDITESACMYRELTEMGIRPEQLTIEDQSASTIENLRLSLDTVEAETGFRPNRVAVISSEYHLFRATQFAKDLGVEAVGIPAKTTWFPLRLNYYLREITAVWKYLVLGP